MRARQRMLLRKLPFYLSKKEKKVVLIFAMSLLALRVIYLMTHPELLF
jgi:hypothetical protein